MGAYYGEKGGKFNRKNPEKQKDLVFGGGVGNSIVVPVYFFFMTTSCVPLLDLLTVFTQVYILICSVFLCRSDHSNILPRQACIERRSSLC